MQDHAIIQGLARGRFLQGPSSDKSMFDNFYQFGEFPRLDLKSDYENHSINTTDSHRFTAVLDRIWNFPRLAVRLFDDLDGAYVLARHNCD